MEAPLPALIDNALMWDQQGESLHSFADRVTNQVDAWETPNEIKLTLCYTLFVRGLPEDYISYLNFIMPQSNNDLQSALRHSVRYQSFRGSVASPPRV